MFQDSRWWPLCLVPKNTDFEIYFTIQMSLTKEVATTLPSCCQSKHNTAIKQATGTETKFDMPSRSREFKRLEAKRHNIWSTNFATITIFRFRHLSALCTLFLLYLKDYSHLLLHVTNKAIATQ